MLPIKLLLKPSRYRLSRTGKRRRAFSLIELVIVIVIIGVIAAIAIPRFSRATDGAVDSTLAQDLAAMRKAIDLYAAEHGAVPDGSNIAAQLTKYTDANGNTSDTNAPPYIYGPYLRRIPPAPKGAHKGQSKISTSSGADVGWVYSVARASIYLNFLSGGTVMAADSSAGRDTFVE